MSRDEFDDVQVREWLVRAADDIEVDVDVEWLRLLDRLEREAAEVEAISGVAPDPGAGLRTARSFGATALVAVAAIVLLFLALAGPVVVRTSVSVVRFVQDVVEPPPDEAPQSTLAPVTTVALPSVASTTTSQPSPTTPVPAATDAAHAPIVNGDAYRLTLRQVHNQLNAAIGYGRSDYQALQGADVLIESLLGQRPRFDADLRDTIGHLRQAMRVNDRRAASAAHTIIERIETELALGR